MLRRNCHRWKFYYILLYYYMALRNGNCNKCVGNIHSGFQNGNFFMIRCILSKYSWNLPSSVVSCNAALIGWVVLDQAFTMASMLCLGIGIPRHAFTMANKVEVKSGKVKFKIFRSSYSGWYVDNGIETVVFFLLYMYVNSTWKKLFYTRLAS